MLEAVWQQDSKHPLAVSNETWPVKSTGAVETKLTGDHGD